MNHTGSPRLKSLTDTPDQPSTATPAAPVTVGGAPKVVAEGVLSSLLPDPRPADGRQPIAWLHVVAPPSWNTIPWATSDCLCGRHVEASGRRDVLVLIETHNAHREVCPLLNPAPERRQAA
ncbi:hypothetical protein [Streptomyces sp. NPDC020917]|uniref:hypothetical protein n=1 Tax=Streptomyces sp. NPDC020917 TaxID=3365102 RepID=UPI0037B44C10